MRLGNDAPEVSPKKTWMCVDTYTLGIAAAAEVCTGWLFSRQWKIDVDGKILCRKALFPAIEGLIWRVA